MILLYFYGPFVITQFRVHTSIIPDLTDNDFESSHIPSPSSMCAYVYLFYYNHTMRVRLLLFAFRDLWKQWGDSDFQIFTEQPVPPHAAGVVMKVSSSRTPVEYETPGLSLVMSGV